MKYFIKKILSIATLILVFSPLNSYGEDFKIGVVDLQKVIVESKNGKQAIKDFEKEFQEKKKKFESQANELDKLKKELIDNISIWNIDTKEKKEEEFNQKLKKYQRGKEEFEEETDNKNSQINQKILKEIMEILNDMAKKENYTVIVEKGSVIFSSRAVDITNKVIEQYDGSRR